MGLADLILGNSNPFAQYVDQNRQTIHGLGAGLASGQNFSQGLSNAAQGAAAGSQVDQTYALSLADQKARLEQIAYDRQLQQNALNLQIQQRNATADWVAKNGHPELAQAIQSGAISGADVFSQMYKNPTFAPPGSMVLPNTFNGPSAGPASTQGGGVAGGAGGSQQPQGGGGFVVPPAPPAGYRNNPDGTQSFIPGGSADPNSPQKPNELRVRNTELAKVILPEAQALLGSNGKPGTFDALSNGWSQGLDAMGPIGLAVGGGPAEAYQQAKNSLKTIIASYLYSTSGATANPGEVENQASVLTPKPGEPAASVADKKRRIATMVQAVVDAANATPLDPNASSIQQGGSGQTFTYNPQTGELE